MTEALHMLLYLHCGLVGLYKAKLLIQTVLIYHGSIYNFSNLQCESDTHSGETILQILILSWASDMWLILDSKPQLQVSHQILRVTKLYLQSYSVHGICIFLDIVFLFPHPIMFTKQPCILLLLRRR